MQSFHIYKAKPHKKNTCEYILRMQKKIDQNAFKITNLFNILFTVNKFYIYHLRYTRDTMYLPLYNIIREHKNIIHTSITQYKMWKSGKSIEHLNIKTKRECNCFWNYTVQHKIFVAFFIQIMQCIRLSICYDYIEKIIRWRWYYYIKGQII